MRQRATYYSMNHSVFTKQDDFAGCTDKPFLVLWLQLTSVQSELLYSSAKSVLVDRANADVFVQVRVECYCTCFQ